MSDTPTSGPEFRYSDLLPTGTDDTPYRLVTTEGVSTFEADGQTFLRVSPEAIQRLTAASLLPGVTVRAEAVAAVEPAT